VFQLSKIYFLLEKELYTYQEKSQELKRRKKIFKNRPILYEFIQSVKFVNIQSSDLLVIKEFLGN